MLRKRVRLKTEELRLVNEILKIFVKYNDVEKVFDKILQIFYSFWSIEAGFIALREEGGQLKVHTAFGFLPSEVERAIYSKGEGITGLTFQLGIPLYATEDKLLNKTGLVKRLKGKELAFFTAPVKVGDKTVGVLGLFKDISVEPPKVEKLLETLSVVGFILGTYLGLKKKNELPPSIADELMKNLDGGRLEGEFLFSSKHEAVKEVLLLIDRLRDFKSPVLFRGAEGVGKATFARLLHETSRRKGKPFEVLDTRGLPPHRLKEILEEKWKASEGGTLLIRRVEFLPPEYQSLLLAKMGDKSVRVLATAGEGLERVYHEGKFLPELYETLRLVEIRIPSLRERTEDIDTLFRFLFSKWRNLLGVETKLSPEVVTFVSENPPRDNIKGLERIVKRLLTLFGNKELITLKDLELVEPNIRGGNETLSDSQKRKKPFTEQLAEEEKRRIIEALERANYVKSRAAKMLGYTLRQLDYRLKKYGIEVKRKG